MNKILIFTLLTLKIFFVSSIAGVDKPVKVAILDTGVKSNSVKSKVISEKIREDRQIDNDHGTNIAKIIESGNSTVIYDARVLNNEGLGTVKNTIDGIDWAIKNKVNVINISYGFTHDYKGLHEKIKEANNKGITIIAANGNDLFGKKEYPASYKETISIGVMKNKNNKSIFNSNDDADIYISINNQSQRRINNTSEATALATNYLIKNHKNNFSDMNKSSLISIIKKADTNKGLTNRRTRGWDKSA